MRESAAFRKQALADIEAAVLLGGATCAPSMRAQVLAKAQQGVEKVMKAAIVMLTHTGTLLRGVRGAPTTNMRAPITHHVAPFAEAITLLAAPGPRRRVRPPVQAIAHALTPIRVRAITHLDGLAPSVPVLPGALHAESTEYPYEVTAHDWLNPSAPHAFTQHRTKWLFDDAGAIVEEIDRIVDALELAYP